MKSQGKNLNRTFKPIGSNIMMRIDFAMARFGGDPSVFAASSLGRVYD
jgi:hypothetical protein